MFGHRFGTSPRRWPPGSPTPTRRSGSTTRRRWRPRLRRGATPWKGWRSTRCSPGTCWIPPRPCTRSMSCAGRYLGLDVLARGGSQHGETGQLFDDPAPTGRGPRRRRWGCWSPCCRSASTAGAGLAAASTWSCRCRASWRRCRPPASRSTSVPAGDVRGPRRPDGRAGEGDLRGGRRAVQPRTRRSSWPSSCTRGSACRS